jgi:hypothetical protein
MNKGPLHAQVIILADRPSKKNIREDVPLVGTKSYETLLTWLARADIDVSLVRIFNQISAPLSGDSGRFLKSARVVTLGKAAMKYVLSLDHVKDFYTLPHPGNHNDKAKLKRSIEGLKNYVYGK